MTNIAVFKIILGKYIESLITLNDLFFKRKMIEICKLT